MPGKCPWYACLRCVAFLAPFYQLLFNDCGSGIKSYPAENHYKMLL